MVKKDLGLLTVEEAAGYLRISRTTLWRLRRGGKVKTVKVGGRALFLRGDLRRLVQKRRGA